MVQKDIPIVLMHKDEPVNDPFAGFYTHYILIANGFILAHFTNPTDRKAYEKMLIETGLNGFPSNIMKVLFDNAETRRRTLRVLDKNVLPEQTGFVPTMHPKILVPFKNYKVEVAIYENIVFDPVLNAYTQFVVTCNDFVVASFTHLIGAQAYQNYLERKGFVNFGTSIQDVIHYYADPNKRLKNVSKEIQ